ncbi:hypothetical protein TIFTF001_025686 [Ficus carica]|uniref:Uncharacterized protein n=1 Tax=Ficus carica TaxID=3494 RepID=A0AA88DHC8_FICCA|nr:hypothetical protein TIFTF001_025686 [Ficus carica]
MTKFFIDVALYGTGVLEDLGGAYCLCGPHEPETIGDDLLVDPSDQ